MIRAVFKSCIAVAILLMLGTSAQAAMYTFYGDQLQQPAYPLAAQAEAEFQSYLPAVAYGTYGPFSHIEFMYNGSPTGISAEHSIVSTEWVHDFNTPINAVGFFLQSIAADTSRLSVGYINTLTGANYYFDLPHLPADQLVGDDTLFWGYINTDETFDRVAIGGMGSSLGMANIQIGWNNEPTGNPAVPEPSTMLLLAVGLGGLAVWRKRSA
ncbi:PEP-CTERM sorting domain-containing protein [Pseudodesulfovibrio cashew]|uniref:PEP-CTERM sorting domain-containing protein n=1 Tax=Pseudodesulfovibrio cashew TaxID=2678688 RepID=A0A6I6JBL0_9BACT|nr:PEP-CTERM sorting domain-containing protein [Pseudodesulfovibrio cashew]QGY39461.1 PEP-CTERM sorting domain-containing protein [Pseudodesulfovibrio cashew]